MLFRSEFLESASDGIGSVGAGCSVVFIVAVEPATADGDSAFVAGEATSVGVGFDSPQPTTRHNQVRLKAVARFQHIRMTRLRVSELRSRRGSDWNEFTSFEHLRNRTKFARLRSSLAHSVTERLSYVGESLCESQNQNQCRDTSRSLSFELNDDGLSSGQIGRQRNAMHIADSH